MEFTMLRPASPFQHSVHYEMLDTWHFDPYRKGRLQYAHQCRLAVVAFPVELHKILVRVCTVEEAKPRSGSLKHPLFLRNVY